MSARGSPAHPRPARVPSAGSSCGRSVRYRIQVPGPGPLLPAAPRRALSEHPGHPARLSAIPHAPFGGGPHPLTSRSLASNDSPPAPRHTASSHYIWPTVTPRIDPRAERRHPCAPRPPNHARRSNWRRLPAQNWRSFLDRYQLIPSRKRAPFVGVWRAPGALRFLQLSPWRSLSQAVSFVVWFTSPWPRLSQAVSFAV